VFQESGGEFEIFHVPGHVAVVEAAAAAGFAGALRQLAEQAEPPHPDLRDHPLAGPARLLWDLARTAREHTDLRPLTEFTPECLTLYLNNECPLRCRYCHTDPSTRRRERLDLATIAPAARLLAAHCQARGVPLSLVFHGGGEPTLQCGLMSQVLELVHRLGQEHQIGIRSYVATNGVLSAHRAAWLANHIDLIGLSCDGPPAIQNRHRPSWNGGATAAVVERTGRIFREAGARFHLRTTITAETLSRQADIAAYLCRQFRPEELRFEPAYCTVRAPQGLVPAPAAAFLASYLQARAVAREYGVALGTSGCRPAALHGPHCHVFRSVVNLVPGGVATACFQHTDAASVRRAGVAIGSTDRQQGRFELDLRSIRELRRALAPRPAQCTDCFCQYHCTGGCPDFCPLDPQSALLHQAQIQFRCHLHQGLAHALIRETATALWRTRKSSAGPGPRTESPFVKIGRVHS
jgi:uncharacterized protein